MPVTALKIVSGIAVSRLKISTVQETDKLAVDTFLCDEEFIPVGNPMMTNDSRDEETYHRQLRKESKEKGHFIAEESTNPEWNDHL